MTTTKSTAISRRASVALAGFALLIGGCATVSAEDPAEPDRTIDNRSEAEFFAAVPASDWIEIAPENLLVVEWQDQADGEARQVVIRLADLDYGSAWADNVRAIAREGYWDDAGIYRVIPPFVAQWGVLPSAASEEGAPEEPAFLRNIPESSFVAPLSAAASPDRCVRGESGICDVYAPQVRLVDGWVMGSDGTDMWPIFCRSTVGVARGMDNQGSGSALYAVLRTDHRNMDRNIGMVGSVVSGLSHLENLPAATGPGGVYADPADARMFTRYSLASDMPEAERPRFRMLRTGSDSHDAWLARLTQPNPFYAVRYSVVDACDRVVPVVPVPEAD